MEETAGYMGGYVVHDELGPRAGTRRETDRDS